MLCSLQPPGWFYHAPAKKVFTEKVDYPAPSNIPGIGFDEPGSLEPEQVKEMMFRETDSSYIRLAKMGGRKGKVVTPRSHFLFLEFLKYKI